MADKDKKPEVIKSVAKSVSEGVTRRGFLKNAAVATTVVAASAAVTKTISTIIPKQNFQKKYADDILAGDKALSEREYVVMSDEEKKDIVKQFESSYKYYKS